MIKKKLNRIIALLFAVVMIVGIIPVQTIPVQAAAVRGAVAATVSSITKANGEQSSPAFAFYIRPGMNSEITPFNHADGKDLTASNGVYQMGWHPTDDKYSGKIGCFINNIGSYRGKTVDVRMTFSWNHLSSTEGEDICPFIGINIANNRLDVVRLTRTVIIKYEFFCNDEPISMNMALMFNDIDGYEIYSFNPGDGTVKDVQCSTDCEVLYAKTGDRYWMESGTQDGLLNDDIQKDAIRFELENVSYYTVTYNGVDADSLTQFKEYTPKSMTNLRQEVIEKYMNATDTHWNTYTESSDATAREEARVYLFEHPAHMFLKADSWEGYNIGSPIKTVSDSDETDVTENHLMKDAEIYTYNILQMIPLQPEGAYYDSVVLTDVLPQNDSCHAEYVSSKVYDGNGNDVTSKFDITVNGQEITCSANTDELKKSSFYGTEYRWSITVKFCIDDTSLSEYSLENSATVSTYRYGEQENPDSSNTVTTKYEQIPLTIEKTWSDADNQEGFRPDSIDVALKLQWITGEKVVKTDDVITVTLSEKNSWKKDVKVWNPESYVKKDGEPEYTFKYIWEEENIPDGYKASQSTEGNKTTITNMYEPQKTAVTVQKVWNDSDNADGLRPDVLKVNLKADGQVIRTVALSESNNWTASVTELAKYSHGTKINYTWEEESIPDGYETSQNTEGSTTVITNIHNPELIQMTVKKEWDDNNDADGLRPASIKVSLIADGECVETYTLSEKNDWTVTVDNLMKNRYGDPIEYTWEETEIPEGYSALYDTDKTVTTITNRHEHEKTAVTIQKRWDDSSNADGLRPASVDADLYADGECIQTITLSDKNDWKAAIENLPMNKSGEKIEYTVKEQTDVEGYTTETVQSGSLFTITNTHVQETRDVKVTLQWEDDNNRDGIRPDEVTVALQADGETVRTIVLNKDNGEQMTITNLPKNKDGKPIKYTFVQEDVDGYTVTYDVTDEQTDITDTHIPEKVSVSVQKIWKDSGHEDARPDSLTVSLYINGEKSDKTVKLSEKNDWKGSVDGLYRYEEGKEQTYAFREDDIPKGYTSRAETDGLNTVITNTFKQSDVPKQEETTTSAPVQPNNTSVTSPKTGYDFTLPFILVILAGLGSVLSFAKLTKLRKIDQKK